MFVRICFWWSVVQEVFNYFFIRTTSIFVHTCVWAINSMSNFIEFDHLRDFSPLLKWSCLENRSIFVLILENLSFCKKKWRPRCPQLVFFELNCCINRQFVQQAYSFMQSIGLEQSRKLVIVGRCIQFLPCL